MDLKLAIEFFTECLEEVKELLQEQERCFKETESLSRCKLLGQEKAYTRVISYLTLMRDLNV